jgi:hypothetical protein
MAVEQGMFVGTYGVVETQVRAGSIRIGGHYVVCGRERVDV